jgi:ribosomal protein S15P/S13E
MTCADVQRVLPEIMDAGGDLEFEAHLKSCPACSELVNELEWIAAESQELAGNQDPPDRVWVRISNQLRAEGIIRDQIESARPVVVARPTRRWSAWWLAPIAVAIVAAGAYQLGHRSAATAPQVAQQQAPQQQTAPAPQVSDTNPQVAQQSEPPAPAPNHPAQLAKNLSARVSSPSASSPAMQTEISPPANGDDEQFLSEVSQGAPTVRATYEKQLRAVNEEIRETQEYIKVHPDDLDARQHLLETYQQKALLYQMALDRIQ